MPKICCFVIWLCISMSGLAFCAAKPEVMYNNNNVTISLQTNPTTGYQWRLLSYNPKFLKAQKSKFTAPKTTLMGAPGTISFPFVVQKSHVHTRVCFAYQRSWEKEPLEKICVDLIL